MPRRPPQGPAGDSADSNGSARLTAEVMKRKSGGPRAGCAVRKWVRCPCLRQKRRHAGWHERVRGPEIAGWCPHPTGRAVPFPKARTRALERGLWPCPARAEPCVADPGTPGRRRLNAKPFPNPQGGPPQARFHPRPGCRPALAGTRNGNVSGGWLGPPGHAWPSGLPAERGLALPPPSFRRTLRQTPGGLPPARPATFANPPAAEVRKVWHHCRTCGRKSGKLMQNVWKPADLAQGLSTPAAP